MTRLSWGLGLLAIVSSLSMAASSGCATGPQRPGFTDSDMDAGGSVVVVQADAAHDLDGELAPEAATDATSSPYDATDGSDAAVLGAPAPVLTKIAPDNAVVST